MTITTKTISTTNVVGTHTRKQCRPVFCITDGIIYASVNDAAESANTNQVVISAVLHGRARSYKGKKYCLVSEMSNYADEIAESICSNINKAKKYDAIIKHEKENLKQAIDEKFKEIEDLKTKFYSIIV